MKQGEVWNHEMRGGMEFGDGGVNGVNMMTNRTEEWNGGTCQSSRTQSTVTEDLVSLGM